MRFIFLLLTCFACAEPNPGYVDKDPAPTTSESSLTPSSSGDHVWVCYHPGTQFHEKECPPNDELFPAGCLVEGDDSKFCWKLLIDDCIEIREGIEWQEKFCPLLVGD